MDLAIDKSQIRATIFEHPEFVGFVEGMNRHFEEWRDNASKKLKELAPGCHPKEVISELAESLLAHYHNKPLLDPYDIYQYLMDYWADVMQDDCYLISSDGWKAETYRVIEFKNGKDGKPGKEIDKGWQCNLIPKNLILTKVFQKEALELKSLTLELEGVLSQLNEIGEEHGGEGGVFSTLDKVNKAAVASRLREIKGDKDAADEMTVLKHYIALCDSETQLKKRIKDLEVESDKAALAYYAKLKEAEVKELVVEDKWFVALRSAVQGALSALNQGIATRIRELAGRYESTLPSTQFRVEDCGSKVKQHLGKMGFAWH
jgi:type I restriction enzyme M protein